MTRTEHDLSATPLASAYNTNYLVVSWCRFILQNKINNTIKPETHTFYITAWYRNNYDVENVSDTIYLSNGGLDLEHETQGLLRAKKGHGDHARITGC